MWSTRCLLQRSQMPVPALLFPSTSFLCPVRRCALASPITLCSHLPIGVGKTQFCIGCCVQAVVRGHISLHHIAPSVPSLNSNSATDSSVDFRASLLLSDESRASLVSSSAQHYSNTFVSKTAERIKNGVIYIDTELKFDSLRLIEVREHQN